MTGGQRGCDFLGLWEEGAGEHPLDRALGLIAGIEGTPRAAAAALPLDRRDRALYRIGERLFGEQIRLMATCDDCGAETELGFSTRDVLAVPAVAERIPLSGQNTVCRLPDSRDLAAALSSSEPQRALVAAVIDAPEPDAATVAAVEAALAAEAGIADLTLAHSCAACGAAGETPFDILDYLWRRITAEAQRLLRDIHTIASAYGWSGEAILALSPKRRAAHVALIGG